MPKVGRFSATACGFLKTPEPMTVPTTTAIAISGPRARTSPGRELSPAVGVALLWLSMAVSVRRTCPNRKPLLPGGKLPAETRNPKQIGNPNTETRTGVRCRSPLDPPWRRASSRRLVPKLLFGNAFFRNSVSGGDGEERGETEFRRAGVPKREFGNERYPPLLAA